MNEEMMKNKGMKVEFEVEKNEVPMSVIHVPVNSATEYTLGDMCEVKVIGRIKGLNKDEGFDKIMACIEFPDKDVELKNVSREDEEEANKMGFKGMKGFAEVRDARAKAMRTKAEREEKEGY